MRLHRFGFRIFDSALGQRRRLAHIVQVQWTAGRRLWIDPRGEPAYAKMQMGATGRADVADDVAQAAHYVAVELLSSALTFCD